MAGQAVVVQCAAITSQEVGQTKKMPRKNRGQGIAANNKGETMMKRDQINGVVSFAQSQTVMFFDFNQR